MAAAVALRESERTGVWSPENLSEARNGNRCLGETRGLAAIDKGELDVRDLNRDGAAGRYNRDVPADDREVGYRRWARP